MSLLRDVVALLEAEAIPHALIGAAAMAVHGVSRSTADVDLLAVESRTLEREVWAGFEQRGVALRVLKGDFDDPLAGGRRPPTLERIRRALTGRRDSRRQCQGLMAGSPIARIMAPIWAVDRPRPLDRADASEEARLATRWPSTPPALRPPRGPVSSRRNP